MAEFTNVALQTVAAGQNVVFTETPICGGQGIVHRDGSGVVTLRGLTNQCRARYRVSFGANIAIPTSSLIVTLRKGAASVNFSAKFKSL